MSSVAARVGVGSSRALVSLILALLAFSAIFPVFFVVTAALKTDPDYAVNQIGLPQEVYLGAISDAWERLSGYLLNSVIVVSASVVIVVALASLAAYGLTHLKLPFSGKVLGVIVSLMIVPAAVLMIPEFRIVLSLGLLNNRLGLILVYTAIQLPFSVFLMATYMRGIPPQLVEAASIDGANSFRTFTQIVLPLVGPAIATLMTLNFLVLWNELLFSLVILQTDELRTIMPGIVSSQGQFLTSVPTVAAGLLFSIVPPLLVFLFLQRQLVAGLTAGAVK